MQKSIFLITLTLFSFSWAAPVVAKSVYASDQLTVPMRTGTSTRHKIIKFISSGEKLKLLESGIEGFSKVMTAGGTEGWIKTTNLISEPGGYEQLDKAKLKLNTEREKIKQLQESIKQLKAERQQLQVELNSERQNNHKLIKENDLLGNEGLRNWFAIGALVSLSSLFLGLIIPRIQWRKKNSWSSDF